MIDKLTSYFCRGSFVAAVLLLFVAVLEWLLRLFGYTLNWLHYRPGRLLELAGILVLFVIVLILRQIRETLKK